MATVLTLTPEIIFKLSADPAIYKEAPFLAPMEKSALGVHAKLRGRCGGCNRKAVIQVAYNIANAFVRLIVDEQPKPGNKLPQLKAAINRVLNARIDEITAIYTDPKGQKKEIRF